MADWDSNGRDSLQEQTVTLLKEQMTKLKLLSNDLELKTQQYQLLKETLELLDEEKMALVEENEKLKHDIVAIIHHNQQQEGVILEKTQSLKEALELESVLEMKEKELREQRVVNQELEKKCKELEEEVLAGAGRMGEKERVESENKEREKSLEEEILGLKDINKKLSTKLASTIQQLQSLATDFLQYKQQNKLKKSKLDSLHSQIDGYKKQLSFCKATIRQLSQKQQNLITLQGQYYQSQKHLQHIQKQLKKIEKQHLLIQQQNLLFKKEENHEYNIQYDISLIENLFLTQELGRFIGPYKEPMEAIGINILKLMRGTKQMERRVSKVQDLFQNKQIEYEEMLAKFLALQREFVTEEQQYKIEVQNIIAKYESVVVASSLKIKGNQEQIQLLTLKSKELGNLETELSTRCEEGKSRENEIKELKGANEHLKGVVQELIVECQEGIEWKRKVNLLKYVIGNLVRHLFFAVTEVKNSMVFKEYLRAEYERERVGKGKGGKNRRLRRVGLGIVFAIRLRNRMKEGREVPGVKVEDRVLKRIIDRSLRSEENHISAQFVGEINSVTSSSSDEGVLIESLLGLFERTYCFTPIEYLSPPGKYLKLKYLQQ